MLSALILDRLATPTFLWAGLAYGAWCLKDFNEKLSVGGLVLVTVWYLIGAAQAVSQESRIDSKGLRAPILRTFTPWNLGVLFQAVWYFLHHRNHEFWDKIFKQGNPNLPYTLESIFFGQRIVFTADEDNVKAILATQFGDYGKGPQFRREWKDFLGLSKRY